MSFDREFIRDIIADKDITKIAQAVFYLFTDNLDFLVKKANFKLNFQIFGKSKKIEWCQKTVLSMPNITP